VLANLVRRSIAPALKKAGIPWHGWHAFRRRVGSVLYELGVPDKVIQEVLRHANVATTQKFYIKVASKSPTAAMKETGGSLPQSRKIRNCQHGNKARLHWRALCCRCAQNRNPISGITY
jgi:hypothetical protein